MRALSVPRICGARLRSILLIVLFTTGCVGCGASVHGPIVSPGTAIEPPVETVPMTETLAPYKSMSIHLHAADGIENADAVIVSLHKELVRVARKAKPVPEILDGDAVGALALRGTIEKMDRGDGDKDIFGEVPETLVVQFELVDPTRGRTLTAFRTSGTRRNDPSEPTWAPAASVVIAQASMWFWSKRTTKRGLVESLVD